MRRYPSKVSKSHLRYLFPKHKDKDRSQQSGKKENFAAERKRQEKNRRSLTVQSSLLFTSQRPSPKVPLRHSFLFWISASPAKTALWHSVMCQMFLFLSLSAVSGCLMWHCKMTGKKFNSIIYHGTLMFYWIKPSAWECFPTLWARSRI